MNRLFYLLGLIFIDTALMILCSNIPCLSLKEKMFIIGFLNFGIALIYEHLKK